MYIAIKLNDMKVFKSTSLSSKKRIRLFLTMVIPITLIYAALGSQIVGWWVILLAPTAGLFTVREHFVAALMTDEEVKEELTIK